MCGNLLHFYTRFHSGEGYTAYPIHYACSVMYLLYPDMFKAKDLQIEVDVSETMHRGRTAPDNREWIKYENPNTRVLFDVDREEFIKILLDGFKKLDKEIG
jgi:inosine-uridine nucleoside N-ribohydrolase